MAFKEKTEAEIRADQYDKLGKHQKKAANNKRQIARVNTQTERFRSGTGHGIAMMSKESDDITAKIAEAERDSKESKAKLKEAKEKRKAARNEHVGKKVAQGKAHGIILYSVNGQLFDSNGKPVSVDKNGEVRIPNEKIIAEQRATRTQRSRTMDSKVVSDTIYPANPTKSQYEAYQRNPNRSDIVGVDAPDDAIPTTGYGRVTSSGHRIDKIYRNKMTGDLCVIAYRDDTGTVWGRGYDPNSGLWKGGDYNLTDEQLRNRTRGMELVKDYTKRGKSTGNGSKKGSGGTKKVSKKPAKAPAKSPAKKPTKAPAKKSTRSPKRTGVSR